MTTNRQAYLRELSPLIGLYAIFLFGNVMLPQLFWRSNNWEEAAAMFLSGVLVAEITTLGAWTALSCSPWTLRIFIGGVLAVLIATAYLVGLQLPQGGSEMPREVALYLYGCSCVGWLATCGFLALLNWVTGRRHITVGNAASEAGATRASLAYLMTVVTTIAVLLTLARGASPQTGPVWSDKLIEAFKLTGIVAIYMLTLFYLCVRLALYCSRVVLDLMVLSAALVLLPPLTISWLTSLRGAFTPEENVYFYLCSVGFVAANIWALSCLRAAGMAFKVPRGNHNMPQELVTQTPADPNA